VIPQSSGAVEDQVDGGKEHDMGSGISRQIIASH